MPSNGLQEVIEVIEVIEMIEQKRVPISRGDAPLFR
jgi:hypothetical protein